MRLRSPPGQRQNWYLHNQHSENGGIQKVFKSNERL